MDWQQSVALLIVAVTAGLFILPRLRPRRFNFEHDTHCGCSSKSNGAAPQSVIFRARKGQRSEIIVRTKS